MSEVWRQLISPRDVELYEDEMVGLPPRTVAENAYIPLEGTRVNSRAARQSVQALLQPRQAVVLGGPKSNDQIEQEGGDEEQKIKVAEEVQLLASAAEAFTASNTVVHTPSDFETIKLDVGQAAYSVRLIEASYGS